MKRGADGDMGSPQKRRRNDEEVRLLIPSKVAGSIIGKGGQNITKLRSQYKASITVPDCPGPERLLNLSSDIDSVCNIVMDVMPNFEQNGAKVGNGDEVDVRMMVHQSQAGCIIGKGGTKIKEIREKLGTRIKIFSNVAPQSTDRVIQIIGEPAKCVDTIREILTLIKNSPIKGAVNTYDPHNFDDVYPDEYGGWAGQAYEDGPRGGGGGFGGGRGGPPRGGMRDGPPRGMRDGPPMRGGGGRFGGGGRGRGGGGGGGGFGGRDDDFGRGGGGGGGGGGRFGGRDDGPPPFGGPRGGGLGRPPPFGDRKSSWNGPSAPFSSPPPSMGSGSSPSGGPIGLGGGNVGPGGKTSTQVTIPKDLAGAIIGKGGGRIRKIRQDSGAGITIDEPLPGSEDRIITISGTSNQIQMAQYLLQQSVHENSNERGRDY